MYYDPFGIIPPVIPRIIGAATVFLRNLSKCFRRIFPPPQSDLADQNLVGQNGDVVASFVQKVTKIWSPESDCGGGKSF